MQKAPEAQRALRRRASKPRAVLCARFFKTGPGEYSEGDCFIGVTMPDIRIVLKTFAELSLSEIQKLLDSPVHEDRMLGLLILARQYKHDQNRRDEIFRFYLKNRRAINNWDLVDVTAPQIVGAHLETKPRTKLLALAKSKNLWDRRIAIVSTQWFINHGDSSTTLKIATILLRDSHDLIHKATGWMLREVGKRCKPGTLEKFLDAHAARMPRTMLRYAIEKFPEKKRRAYLDRRAHS